MEQARVIVVQVVAIVCFLNGLSMLVLRGELKEIFFDLARNRSLSYVIGSVLVVIGASIVSVMGMPTTIRHGLAAGFGWMNLVEGTLFLAVPGTFVKRYVETMLNDKTFLAIAVGYLGLAAALFIF
jgi:hypothetical protein